jgi:hypothetical protein
MAESPAMRRAELLSQLQRFVGRAFPAAVRELLSPAGNK